MAIKEQHIWIAALALIITFLMATGIGFWQMQSKLDHLEKGQRDGSLWTVSQLELELLRFNAELARFASGDDLETPESINQRFNILWSRLDLLSQGSIGDEVATLERNEFIIGDLESELIKQEQKIVGLAAGDASVAKQLYRAFAPHEKDLRELSLSALKARSQKDLNNRQALSFSSKFAFALSSAVTLLALLAGSVFWIDARRHQRISTENSKLLEQTQRAFEIKSEFVSIVSHELRTPLTAIKGTLGLIDAGALGETSEKLKLTVGMALRNCNRLAFMVNDLLDIEKLESGKMHLEFEALNLVALATEAAEANQSFGEVNDVTICPPETREPLFISGDKNRLMQVMTNILSNACKFSKPGSDVVISLEKDATYARILITDQGIGIPEGMKTYVFEKFSQVDSSNQRNVGGSGLGLSIAQSIVEGHGGTIDYSSELGVGTTFLLEFKRLDESLVNQQPNILAIV